MKDNLTSLERAFELAKSGSCGSLEDLKRALVSEGYSTNQIVGRSLTNQLRALLNSAPSKQPTD
jgi:hypothetical protein